jgi:peptidoglycan/xylan/chitin deacetylase (PgdA/CDA1 family)
MSCVRLWQKVINRYRWSLLTLLARRNLRMTNRTPIVSFTFDDFPRSALHVGGEILRAKGFAGTYYASLGLMDQDSPTGSIFSAPDLETLIAQGHELGCHTFAHCNAWQTSPDVFEASILENRRALSRLLPNASFETLSYPIDNPRLCTKRRAGHHFACCRGGWQRFNKGTIDLNKVLAFFLEKSRDRPESIRAIIEHNAAANGWLVFATHDISERPTQFGCTPALFEQVVQWTADSGAKVLPVARALKEMSTRHHTAHTSF